MCSGFLVIDVFSLLLLVCRKFLKLDMCFTLAVGFNCDGVNGHY
jgi:hypothetical protein